MRVVDRAAVDEAKHAREAVHEDLKSPVWKRVVIVRFLYDY
jgi:hypothetical protein